ncbi:hypothetical protein FJR38_00970 [Anabaena sp. UHCC 0253]|uniref:hypothetical protein n=1 Tax=Anabaena sp. UHCC 0253 TaxID=2590019 RepID=UPI001446BF90|nr:hypothetical protein [Anabaena sp. UHCC 0253]MTJ51353.1 hypothetical protein [Anabaena sp. UHCC 0253]
MSDAFMHEFPGSEISLKFLPPKEHNRDLQWAADAMDALDELRTVIQPLSADLVIGCRDISLQWRNTDVRPQFPHWFIHTSSLPKTVVVRPGFIDPQISQVPELSRDSLMVWIEKALQQECSSCSATHEPGWYLIEIWAVRAKIFDENNFRSRQSFMLDTNRGEFIFPLKRRNEGLWVYSPIDEFKTEPSFHLKVISEEGTLKINMYIHWSLWSTPGTAENTALRQALSRIANQGWDLTHVPSVFQI